MLSIMSKSTDPEEKRHPIQVAANRSGLSPDVLRAWEKRYGAVDPDRTGGGQRRYSDQDIERLRLLREVTEAGRRIGDVADRPTDELSRMVREDHRAEARLDGMTPDEEERLTPFLVAAFEAADDLDAVGLENILERAQAVLPTESFLGGLVGGVMKRVGECWQEGRMRPGQEHVASGVVRRVLMELLARARPFSDAPRIVIGTPRGELHEIGALIAGCMAALEGWEVVYSGPDLPAAEIAELARRTAADQVGLSIVRSEDPAGVVDQIGALRKALHGSCTIVVGGAGAMGLSEQLTAAGGRVVEDLREFRGLLRESASPSS